MDLTAGYPFSLIKYGLPYNYPSLNHNEKTEVVIIGGGISGALIAHHLVKKGIECILIDGRTIGLGSTCASTSFLQYEIDVPLVRLADLIGRREAVTAYRMCSEAIDKLEKIANLVGFRDFERKKSLHYAAVNKDRNFIKEEYQFRKANGFDVQLLEDNAVKKSYNFETAAAILSAQGAHANAYTFTHALLQYNIPKGLKVYDRTYADKIIHKKNEVVLHTSAGNTIRAAKMIYANGYEAVKYIDKKIVNLRSTYAVCSEQMYNEDIAMEHGAMLWSTGDPYLYMRTTTDNRIMIGGRDEKFYDPAKRDNLISKKSRELVKDFKKMFCGADFKPEFSWAGTFGSTKDGLPFIGRYKPLTNSYFALGFGGNGITFSLIAAEILTKEILGKSNPYKIFSFDRM